MARRGWLILVKVIVFVFVLELTRGMDRKNGMVVIDSGLIKCESVYLSPLPRIGPGETLHIL